MAKKTLPISVVFSNRADAGRGECAVFADDFGAVSVHADAVIAAKRDMTTRKLADAVPGGWKVCVDGRVFDSVMVYRVGAKK